MSHKVEARARNCTICGSDSTSVLFACARSERDRTLLGDHCLVNVVLGEFRAHLRTINVGESVVRCGDDVTTLDYYRLPLV
jgi:hypothetical protein